MIPPGTESMPVCCGSKWGLNGLELFKPYNEPPGCVGAYRFAVERAKALLLKSLAVPAFAMAIARLPGHGSLPLLITEQRLPLRSTIADHMRFGLKMPPLWSGRLMTVLSFACNALTVAAGMPHSLSHALASVGSAKSRAKAGTNSDFFMVISPCRIRAGSNSHCRRRSMFQRFWYFAVAHTSPH